jgi:segregation and condensation protein B
MSSIEGNQQSHTIEGASIVLGDAATEMAAAIEGELGPGLGLEDPVKATGVDSSEDALLGPGEQLDDESLLRALTALVYASPEPLSERRLQQLLERPAMPRVRAALLALSERLTETSLPLELRQIAGGWQILTVADLGPVVQRLEKVRKAEKLSGAALETLAVVAYRQPVTKA